MVRIIDLRVCKMFSTWSAFILWLSNVSIKLNWVFICFICGIHVLYELSDTGDINSYRILGQKYRMPSQTCGRSGYRYPCKLVEVTLMLVYIFIQLTCLVN